MPPDPENAVEEPTWQFFNPVPRGPLPTVPQEPPKPEIELTIDGKETSVPAGTTLLQAAQSLEIETPTLWLSGKPDSGQCLSRLCGGT